MVSSLCLEMNLYDLVMSALGPSTALVLPSLDQTDSFSRHSDDTKHSSSSGVMISANDEDDDDDNDDDDHPKMFFKSAKTQILNN